MSRERKLSSTQKLARSGTASARCAHILFNLLELRRIETLIPADVDEHLDAAVELQQGLRRGRRALRTEQGREVEHICMQLVGYAQSMLENPILARRGCCRRGSGLCRCLSLHHQRLGQAEDG
jgi:hypothetical protein